MASTVFGRWGRYEADRFESYTIPNTRCRYCGALVHFYQSEYGGRVFFERLGWPWDKHDCLNVGSELSISRRSRASNDAKGRRPAGLSKPHILAQSPLGGVAPEVIERLTLSALETQAIHEKRIREFSEVDWRPLIRVRIDNLESHSLVRANDPLRDYNFRLIISPLPDPAIVEDRPTFIKVAGKGDLKCEIVQLDIDEVGELRRSSFEAWLDVVDMEGVGISRAALSGDVGAMRSVGRQKAFYKVQFRDQTPVRHEADLECAAHLFEAATNLGSLEAKFEAAYLVDIAKNHSILWLDIPRPIERTLIWLDARMNILEKINSANSSMDRHYYVGRVLSLDKTIIRQVHGDAFPNLRREIERYINNNPIDLERAD